MQPDRVGNPGLVYEWLHDRNLWKKPSDGSEISAMVFDSLVLKKVYHAKDLNREATAAVGPQRFLVRANGADDTCEGCGGT